MQELPYLKKYQALLEQRLELYKKYLKYFILIKKCESVLD